MLKTQTLAALWMIFHVLVNEILIVVVMYSCGQQQVVCWFGQQVVLLHQQRADTQTYNSVFLSHRETSWVQTCDMDTTLINLHKYQL